MKRLKEAIESRCRVLKVEPIDSHYEEFLRIYKECLYGKYEKARVRTDASAQKAAFDRCRADKGNGRSVYGGGIHLF